ncbi:alanine dehydrogenase [Fusibacillus kribbianus]|uniref:alanine dehydrogenase n=1 Tax=Fusibacillus kribbianus TaxID=3044208 RepID=A0AAP4BB07_9FIRM|nr:alanine dehydrogenase [Ruminococcus sp. YH-rum2234]MDI9242537.1 alanine dehydrogenase [Ruminococcus sp. YH-rum2234]
MVFGLLKDIKNGEYRVIATPSEIASIVADGHTALVQKGAGEKAGFEDEEYVRAGAELVDTAEEMYARSDFLTKVKEFEPCEFDLLRENQIVFTCIHPAAHPEEVQALLNKKVIAFTAEDSHRYGSPNCEAAGKQGALMGLESMLSINGGKGKFVSGLGGAPGMKVLILGGGVVGQAALSVLHALGAWVTVMDINIGTLRSISRQYHEQVNTMISTKENIAKLLPETDMVLNCVKWPKNRTDHLIDRAMVKTMSKGSVIVDISNDVGVIETFHETTHENPRYIEEGVVHYCVSNIPGAIANSTSVAYAASVLPHFRSIMNQGVAAACAKDGFLRRSLTAYKGYLTHEETSALQGRPWIRPEDILGLTGQNIDPAPPATVTRSENFIPLEDVKL